MPLISILGGSNLEGAGNGMSFVVSLSEASQGDVVVQFRTVSETAYEAFDFRGELGTLTFAPGETSKTIVILDYSDSLNESDESFHVELFNARGATFSGDVSSIRARGTIQDDDGTGSNLALFVSDATIVEGDAGTRIAVFNISLSRSSSAPITMNFQTVNGTAISGSDYQAVSGSLTFNAGQTNATVSVPVFGDGLSEGSETFSLLFSPVSAIANGTQGAEGIATIIDDDAGNGARPVISVSDAVSYEDGGLDFAITLSEASQGTVTVAYRTVSGTANEDYDFQPTGGTITFAPGQTTAIVTVNDYSDSFDEADEAFGFQLFNASGATLAGDAAVVQATGTILDLDGQGSNLGLFVSDAAIAEGNDGSRNAVFEIRLSQPFFSTITLNYATTNGTAVASTNNTVGDYQAVAGQVTFAPGQSVAAVSVPILGDGFVEGSESFSLVVTPTIAIANGARGAVGQGVILDDDSAGTSSLPIISVVAVPNLEDGGQEFVITLSRPAPANFTVNYRTLSGTAIGGDDYQTISGTLNFLAGQTSQSIVVNDYSDSGDESDENFILEFFDPNGAVLAGGASTLRTQGVILDTDGSGSNLAMFLPTVTASEVTGSALVEVTLSQAYATAVTLSYQTSDGTALAGQDYVATSGSIVFAPGQTVASLSIALLSDLTAENAESFGLSFSGDSSIFLTRPSISTSIQIATDVAVTGNNDSNTLTGNDVGNILSGLGGNDTISGFGGVDGLYGGDGDDRLYGGSGNDYLYGEAGNDFMAGENGVDAFFGGIGNDTAYGGTDGDYIYGEAGSDSLHGESGNDVLIGGADNDYLYGEADGDYLYGEDGSDALFGGGARDNLYGQGGVDYLYGEEGNDQLEAGDGADALNGGLGNDTLYGQGGGDYFYFNGVFGQDQVADFSRAQGDRLVFAGGEVNPQGGVGYQYYAASNTTVFSVANLGQVYVAGFADFSDIVVV